MKFKSYITYIFIILIICSCGNQESTDPQKDIIGKWESSDKTLTLEFTDQGKVNSVKRQDHFTNESTSDLIFVDETNILGVWEFSLQTWSVHIYGGKMTLISANGEKLKLSKVD